MSDIINVRFSRVLEKKIKPQWMLVIDITFTEPCCYITTKQQKTHKTTKNTQNNKKPTETNHIFFILLDA
jgi:hypothetical protein